MRAEFEKWWSRHKELYDDEIMAFQVWLAAWNAATERAAKIAEDWSDNLPGGCDGSQIASLIREES